MKNYLLFMGFLFAGVFSGYSQRGYTEFKTQDGIKVMYRWQRLNPLQKDSDAVLNLRVTNLTESHVEWTHSVIFYNDKLPIYESEPAVLCLKPGQSARGGFADLRFTVEGMKLDVVNTDLFDWEFFDFEVKPVESCDKKTN
jgi:hypothetical protein